MIKHVLACAALLAAATGCSRQASETQSAMSTRVAATPAAASAAPAKIVPPAPSSAADTNQANSAGDIPDTQAFVTYAGPGYTVLVPEGWSRTQHGSAVTFTWNADGEQIETGVPGDLSAVLRAHGANGNISVRRASGAASATATFASRSEPNAVTGKSVPLENQAYLFARNGRRALLLLWAPAGSDNVDQWNKISASFRWK